MVTSKDVFDRLLPAKYRYGVPTIELHSVFFTDYTLVSVMLKEGLAGLA